MQNRLILISDYDTKLKFLIDTGAVFSIIPPKCLPKGSNKVPTKSGITLSAANGSNIKVYGEVSLTLSLGLRRVFHWLFLVADVSQPIIGIDFLSHFGLSVNAHKQCLFDANTQLTARGQQTSDKDTIGQLTVKHGTKQFEKLMANYPTLIKANFHQKPSHEVTHHIVTNGPPVFAKARRLAPDKLILARNEFEHMLELGIIRQSNSPYASPLHMVEKTDSSWRACGDFRALNNITVPDRYNLPNINDFTSNLFNKNIFSEIDLQKAFHQIPMNDDDISKTAIITPFGLFEYLKMPFGLRNSAQTFQRFIDHVLRGLDFCFPYVDNILIASTSEAEHLKHLTIVFDRLVKNNIIINVDKCQLGKSELLFLGHFISKNGLIPNLDKVEVIKNFKIPETQTKLREFLGMVNFYRKFIPNGASILQPLNNLLKGPKKAKTAKILWSPAAQQSFDHVKNALCNATILEFPNPTAQLSLTVDASSNGVGAVLQQLVDGSWKPLGFFSKTLSPAQTRYSTFSRELTAIFLGLKHFRYMLEARDFVIYTDHKPITHAIFTSSDKHSPREARQLDFILQFTSNIQYVKGEDNLVADALSRISISNINTNLDLHALALEQKDDPIITNNTSSLKLVLIKLPGITQSLYCDISKGITNPRIYVPHKYRTNIFHTVHNLAHPGANATLKLLTKTYVWPEVNMDVRSWTKTCINCQKSKVTRHTKSPIQTYPLPNQRFDNVHIDLVGPLPTCQGKQYLLTCIDRFTRWTEAFPISSTTSEVIATTFLEGWIARYGVPSTVTTDRGQQLISNLWNSFLNLLGTSALKITAYHPQSNGIIERFHRQLKASLNAKQSRIDWVQKLPFVLLSIRSQYKQDLNCTPAELVYGTALRLPADLIANTKPDIDASTFVGKLKQCMQDLQPSPTRHANRTNTFIHTDLHKCDNVFVRRDMVKKPLTPPYDGPFAVIKRFDKTFIINRNGKKDRISIDRLKPAYVDAEDQNNSKLVKDEILLNKTHEVITPEIHPTNKLPKIIIRQSKNSKQFKIIKPIINTGPKNSRIGRIIKKVRFN